MASSGSESQRIWFLVKDAGQPSSLWIEKNHNIDDLKKAIKKEVQPRLDNIAVDAIFIYKTKDAFDRYQNNPTEEDKAQALNPRMEVFEIPITGDTELYVDYPDVEEPRAKKARVELSEAFKEAAKEVVQESVAEAATRFHEQLQPTPSTFQTFAELWSSAVRRADCTVLKQVPLVPDGDAAIPASDLPALAEATPERSFKALLKPHLQRMFPAPDVIMDSQDCEWPEWFHKGKQLKIGQPDFFRCFVCQPAGQPGAGQGIPHKELLDCVHAIESKCKPITDSDRGQLYKYLQRLPSSRTKGMLVDRQGFELMTAVGEAGTDKVLMEWLVGKWSAPGSAEAIRDFFKERSSLECFVRQVLQQRAAKVSGFLGRGGRGYVFKVQLPGNNVERAMKLILSDQSIAGFDPQSEIDVMMSAADHGCPVVRPLEHCWKSDLGWHYCLEDVGRKVSIQDAKTYCEDLFNSLRILHANGFAHGDARVPNVVWVRDEFRWIDFLDCPFFGTAAQRSDIKKLMHDLAPRSSVNFEDESFQNWPTEDGFIHSVLKPLLSLGVASS